MSVFDAVLRASSRKKASMESMGRLYSGGWIGDGGFRDCIAAKEGVEEAMAAEVDDARWKLMG